MFFLKKKNDFNRLKHVFLFEMTFKIAFLLSLIFLNIFILGYK